MIYQNKKEWVKSSNKRVSLLGMSGLGKTRLSNMLQSTFNWFHYSIDYRIGTRYLDEFIVDNFKQEAMKNSFLIKYSITSSVEPIAVGSRKRQPKLERILLGL